MTLNSREQEVFDLYREDLQRLTINSKPVIGNLTELANEYRGEFAHVIVRLIEDRIRRVRIEEKLPCLYLLDSIIKNHSDPYLALFQQNIVSTFTHVFQTGNERTRVALHKLRTTWNGFFSPTKLNQLDIKIHTIDPAWPVVERSQGARPQRTAPDHIPTSQKASGSSSIHLNPAVFGKRHGNLENDSERFAEELKKKELELMELKKKKLELEMIATQKQIAEREAEIKGQLNNQSSGAQQVTEPGTGSSSWASSTQSQTKNIIVDERKMKDPGMRDKLPKEVTDMLNQTGGGASSKGLPKSKTSEKKPEASIGQRAQSATMGQSSSSTGSSEQTGGNSSPLKSRQSPNGASSPRGWEDKGPPPPPKIRLDSSEGTEEGNKGSRFLKDDRSRKRRNGSKDMGPSPKTGKSVLVDHSTSESVDRDHPTCPSSIRERKDLSKARKFRIPKRQIRDGRPVSPASLLDNVPQNDFVAGHHPGGGRKKKGFGHEGGPTSKKAKSNKHASIDSKSSSGQSWAKVKEVNPDRFRTPMEQHNRGDGSGVEFNRGGRRGGNRRNDFDRRNFEAWPARSKRGNSFSPEMGSIHQHGFNGVNIRGVGANRGSGVIDDVLRNVRNCDPDVVMNQVIPNIVRQGKELLASNKISPQQFSEMMNGVLELKEQALMRQAEKLHHTQTGEGLIDPWDHSFGNQQYQGIAGPVGGTQQLQPLLGGPGLTSQVFCGASEAMNGAGGANRDLPMVSDTDLAIMEADPVRKIAIDGHPRDVRFYGEIAVIFMGPEARDVRTISFKPDALLGGGSARIVTIDGTLNIPLEIGVEHYTEFNLGGPHRIKIGAPTRELWIDGQWHEIYFDKSARLKIGSSYHDLYLGGPAPQVDIGSRQRNDICAGTVQLVIDANINTAVTIYLDSKPQLVQIAGKPHILRFVQGLKLLLINGHPFKTEFGGVPMVVYVNQIKHYLRLTSLPAGIKPGKVALWDMDTLAGQVAIGHAGSWTSVDAHDESKLSFPPSPPTLTNDNSQDMQNTAFDRMLSMMPSSTSSAATSHTGLNSTADKENCGNSNGFNYKSGSGPVEKVKDDTDGKGEIGVGPSNEGEAPNKQVDVHSLWAQLLGAGLVSDTVIDQNGGIPGLDATSRKKSPTPEDSAVKTPAEDKTKPEGGKETTSSTDSTKGKGKHITAEAGKGKGAKKLPGSNNKGGKKGDSAQNASLPDVVLRSHHPSLKRKQQSVINSIYDPAALQCKTCGLRYSPTEMIAYSQHLDWHFRMKRREKENAKKAESRKWYLDQMDWIISDEMEDDKELNEDPVSRSNSPQNELSTLPASLVREENICPICQEEFDQFYKHDFDDSTTARSEKRNDDNNEGMWHLRNAVGDEDSDDKRAYHPHCLQDKKKAEANSKPKAQVPEQPEVEEESEVKSEVIADASKLEEEEKEEGIDVDDKVKPDLEGNESDVQNVVKEDGSAESSEDRMPDRKEVEMEIKEEVVDDGDGAKKSEEHPLDDLSSVKVEPQSAENAEATKGEKEEHVDDDDNGGDDDGDSTTPPAEDVKDVKDETELGKAEKEEMDEPEHLEANKSLDENSSSGMAAPVVLPLKGSSGIKINISNQLFASSSSSSLNHGESAISLRGSSSEEGSSAADLLLVRDDLDVDAIVQPAREDDQDLKPKMKGRTFVELPMQRKDSETSGLCSIM